VAAPPAAPGTSQPQFDVEPVGHQALAYRLVGGGETAVLRSIISGGEDEAMKQLAELEAKFDQTQAPAAIKEMLIGSWKCLVAFDADPLRTSGLAGLPANGFAPACRLVGQLQTYRKPDPMDILNGVSDRKLLETTEVVLDSRTGATSTSTIQGGYTVDRLSSGGIDVVEYYSVREPASDVELRPNSWSCAYISPMLRSCKLADGSRRVYARVEAVAAAAAMERLGKLPVKVDPAMVAAWNAAEAAKQKKGGDEEEDDPNDNRPMWQKRIDKADGIKRTKNGTPIINHGPPTA